MKKNNNSENSKSRRQFIKTTAIGGIAALSLPSMSFGKKITLSTKLFKAEPSEFDEISITELSEGLKSGKYTVRAITEHYIKRINEIDKNGPAINSVIELNPDALSIADSLDKELKEKGTPQLIAWNSNSNKG